MLSLELGEPYGVLATLEALEGIGTSAGWGEAFEGAVSVVFLDRGMYSPRLFNSGDVIGGFCDAPRLVPC